MMHDMGRGEKTYVYGMSLLAIAAWAFAWPMVRPAENQGSLRFEDTSVVTVDASALIEWGGDQNALREWGVPVEFVDHDAMVRFQVGETPHKEVPGFGTAYVAGQADRQPNHDNWVEQCVITLSDRYQDTDRRSATAIAVHEFGHCLGMQHDDTEKSIMSTYMDSDAVPNPLFSYTPTAADKEWLAKVMAS